MIKVAIFLLFVAFAAAAGGHRRRAPKCGLPAFTDRLPEDAQTKIKKIWEKYEEGKGCEDEHEKTKEVLDELPADVRNKAMRANKGPAFLKGASDEVRAQFDALWKNHTIPREEKPEKFKELAEKLEALTPEARAAHEKLTKLREERHKIFMDASESVREELNKLYHDDRKKHKGRDQE